jgi:hypothetical protein
MEAVVGMRLSIHVNFSLMLAEREVQLQSATGSFICGA